MINNKNFPQSPGVYFFKDKDNTILYIGKAKVLKKRINSYFSSSDFKVIELLQKATDIEWITTDNEIEALFLEAQLIKQHQPSFNRLLKAGNPYIYIFFSDTHQTKNNRSGNQKASKLSTISIVRFKRKKGDYFGPFLTKKDAQFVVEYLKKSLQLTICTTKIETGCLQYHINICAGSCKKDFDETFYIFRLNLARQILDNQYEQVINQLDEEISINNKNLNFEKSAHLVKYKHALQAIIKTLQALQTTKFSNIPRYVASLSENKTKTIEEHASNINLLSLLKHRLHLKKIPYTIDCFDISHMQSQSMVGSCIRFLNGKPDKKNFRHFGIKSLIEQNDYAALCEIVQRRYKKREDYPDLIIIDGGKGQLSATQHLAGPAEIISLAKTTQDQPNIRQSQTGTIFFPNQEKTVELTIHNQADRLLLQIRDYAHHFAISYHRKKQKLI